MSSYIALLDQKESHRRKNEGERFCGGTTLFLENSPKIIQSHYYLQFIHDKYIMQSIATEIYERKKGIILITFAVTIRSIISPLSQFSNSTLHTTSQMRILLRTEKSSNFELN